jgi:hypothetical protein
MAVIQGQRVVAEVSGAAAPTNARAAFSEVNQSRLHIRMESRNDA